jgi:hypothetical protein
MIRIRKQYEILKRKTITIHYPGNNAFHFPPVPPALNHSLSEASFVSHVAVIVMEWHPDAAYALMIFGPHLQA